MIRRLVEKIRLLGQPKAMILMYHRVDEPACDPWQLAVSPAHFEQQLQMIQQHWNPVSLAELAQGVVHGSVVDRSVALTFDDGYIDNYEVAKPLLERYTIPATFFIPSQNCEQQALFWWDELQEIIIHTQELPQEFSLTVQGESLAFSLGDEAMLTPELQRKHRSWVVDEGTPTQRSRVYVDLWRRIRPLPNHDIQQVMNQLRQLAGQVPPTTELVCMTPGHIRQLIKDPLFSVGGHTVTHPALADHTADDQRREITDNRTYLEKLTGTPVTLFAYPYGSYNETTVAILNQEQVSTAVTTSEGLVTKWTQPLRFNRYQVNNWNGAAFYKQLTHWYRN